eukprot:3514832-Rhodomonas_salina.2
MLVARRHTQQEGAKHDVQEHPERVTQLTQPPLYDVLRQAELFMHEGYIEEHSIVRAEALRLLEGGNQLCPQSLLPVFICSHEVVDFLFHRRPLNGTHDRYLCLRDLVYQASRFNVKSKHHRTGTQQPPSPLLQTPESDMMRASDFEPHQAIK